MAISSRASLALGLGLLGVAGFMGVTYGQQDGAVRKAAGNGTAAPPTTAAPTMKPTVIATLDLEIVLRGYEKAKYQAEQLQAESLAKQGQLKALYTEAQQIAKEMESLQSASKDFKDRGAKLNELKARLQSGKETLQTENQMKYVEMMAGCYKEVQDMATRYAKSRGFTCVLKVSAEPIKSEDPESVMAAMARGVVYSDPAMDITRNVLWNLNKEYTEAGGPIAKNPPGAATLDEAAAPASTEKPAAAPARPAAPAARPAATKGQK